MNPFSGVPHKEFFGMEKKGRNDDYYQCPCCGGETWKEDETECSVWMCAVEILKEGKHE